MSKGIICYKVLYCKNKKLYSLNANNGRNFILPELIHRYNTKETNIAKIGGFLVFDDKEYAFNYCSVASNKYRIYKVLCKKEVRLPEFESPCYIGNIDKLKRIWKTKNTKTWWDVLSWPPYTRAFKEIRFLELLFKKD